MNNQESKIVWLANSAIDRQKWDACIDQCEWGKVYAISWYLDFLTENNWGALIWGDYDYVMPVPLRKKFGIKYAYRPNFCQQLGVFAASGNLPAEVLEIFVNELTKKIKHLHYPFNHKNSFEGKQSLHFKKRTNLILNLHQSYEAIYIDYSGNLKKNLKTADSNNLRVQNDITTELVISLYKEAWQKLNAIPDADYSNFQNLVEWGKKNNRTETIGIYKEDTLLAACVLFRYKNRLYYPFSAISAQGRKFAATSFLIDNIIRKYAETDCYLDFEGSDIESVKSFYEKFGPEKEYYYQLDKVFPFFKKVSEILKRFIPSSR